MFYLAFSLLFYKARILGRIIYTTQLYFLTPPIYSLILLALLSMPQKLRASVDFLTTNCNGSFTVHL